MRPPGYPPIARPAPGSGWWTASAVLAFLGLGGAASVLGSMAVMAGFLGFFVAVQGGAEGVGEISDDFVRTTTWLFYLFLGMQLVSLVLGLWGGRNCLRGKRSGAVMTILVGALGLAEVLWLGIAFEEPGRMAVGILATLVVIICPMIALRFPQPPRTAVPGQPPARTW